MTIYAIKNNQNSRHQVNLKKALNSNSDFIALQVIYDSTTTEFVENDFKKFILVHIKRNAIKNETVHSIIDITDENGKKIKAVVNAFEIIESYAAYLVQNDEKDKFVKVLPDKNGINFNNLNYNAIENVVSVNKTDLKALNCSTSRFPQCQY